MRAFGIAVNSTIAFGKIASLMAKGISIRVLCDEQYISQLPVVPEVLIQGKTLVKITDGKKDIPYIFDRFIYTLYRGYIISFMVNIKTDSNALLSLLDYTKIIFENSAGRKLTGEEIHLIIDKLYETVYSGPRTTAFIDLSKIIVNDSGTKEILYKQLD